MSITSGLNLPSSTLEFDTHKQGNTKDVFTQVSENEIEPEVLPILTTLNNVISTSVPCVLSLIGSQFITLMNIYFIGNYNDPKLLAGVGLGTMIFNVFGLAVILGLNGSIETFVSQDFGRGNKPQCGQTLNRARIIIALMLLPAILIFLFSEILLIKLD